MEEEKKTAEKPVSPSSADAQVAAQEHGTGSIDFEGLKTLGKSDAIVPDPWPVRFGWGLLELLVQFGLFLAGIVLDILKALIQVVVGFVKGVYHIILAIGRFFRGWHRIFHEVDGAGKASFFFQGVGQFHYGQRVDGIIFFAVEILFVLFMVFFGGADIANLIPKTIEIVDVQTKQVVETATCLAPHYGQFYSNALPNSVFLLIRGLIAITIIVAYFIVYCKGIRAMYDDYQILHNFEFRQAHEDQLHVLRNRHHYEHINFEKDSAFSIKRKMRKEYGYSVLSSRYISYVPFKRIPYKKENVFSAGWDRLVARYYAHYSAWRKRIRAGRWSSIFAPYLEWEPKKRAPRYGLDVVEGETKASLIKFHHTYDKYNNYLSTTRDWGVEIAALKQNELLCQCVYAEDPISKANGDQPIPHDAKIKTSAIVTRIVGALELPLDIARDMGKIMAKGRKRGGDEGLKNAITSAYDYYSKELAEFVQAYRTDTLESVHNAEKAYGDYANLRPIYDKGEKAFKEELRNVYHLRDEEVEMIYQDYRLAIKSTDDVVEDIKAQLLYRQSHYHKIVALYETYPFHGQPIRFKREIKMYTDERFSTTVLSLPVLGAMAMCVIPLIFSIVIAFTNYDRNNTAGYFTWSNEAFQQFFGQNSMAGYSGAFMKLLGWTIVWAFFATFTNYIFGIILALLINKKGIALKKMWRTIFVITIAIPQFITLLTMNLLLSDNGAINGWLLQQSWYTAPNGLAHQLGFGYVEDGQWIATYFPFLSDSSHNAVWPKITLIVVNMWIGIPYTMLSTSGILMNIPDDLYESARIDGANAWTQFWKITMPYVLFVTGPSLLTTFIGNINNFNVIYFLTGGGPSVAGILSNANAGSTDLLITWLYKLTVNKFDYSTASVIGLGVFLICSFFSLIVYKRLGSTKNEEEFQ
jgi:ABC-type sugar transport system permease subunit